MVRIISVASLGVHFSDYGDDQPTDGIAFERDTYTPPSAPPKQEQPRRMSKGGSLLKAKSSKKKE